VKKYKKDTRIELEKYWTKQLSEKWKKAIKLDEKQVSCT